MSIYQTPEERAEQQRIDTLFEQAARMALAAGVPIDCTPECELTRWVLAHIKIRAGTLFYVVFILACVMGRIERETREAGEMHATGAAALAGQG